MNRFSKFLKDLGHKPTGEVIPPWGSARDTYFQVEEGRLDDAEKYLERRLKEIASVLRVEDAIEQGLFGINRPSRKFRRRVGNLMILPHGNKTVWYRYRKGDSLELRGHHGGLSEDEMTIPLAAARVSDLL